VLKVVSTGVPLFQMTHKYFMPKLGSIRQYLLVAQIDKKIKAKRKIATTFIQLKITKQRCEKFQKATRNAEQFCK